MMNKDKLRSRQLFYKRLNDTNQLLDGLIEHRNDLGELGWELEKLLRKGGVIATIDPELPNIYH